MEILFISHKFPPAVGGMEKQSFELIQGMGKLAIVHRIVYTGQESRLKFFLCLEKRILKMCDQFPGISVIHFNDALIATVCLRHKAYNHLFRVVTVHGLDVVFPNPIFQKRIIPAFNRFDLIIAVSKATAMACLSRGINPESVKVVANGVDHSLLGKQPDPAFLRSFEKRFGLNLQGKVILTLLGRPVKRKGISWFIDKVYPQLSGNFMLLVIGSFHQKRTWTDKMLSAFPEILRNQIQLAAGYPTDENAIRDLLLIHHDRTKMAHLSKLVADDLIEILAATDALLMPNIKLTGDMEGFGLVGLEASLCGSWIFASEADGIPDAVHPQKNGTLIPSGNAELWTSTLNDFISNPSLFNKNPEEARKYTAAHFGWERMVKGYLELFKFNRNPKS